MTGLNDFNMYQQNARKTAIYPDVGGNLWYPALGLNGEAGEVAEKVKKIYRDHDGIVTATDRTDICRELGDVLWYVANIACELHIDLSDIADSNIVKLMMRADRDKVHGEGDDR